MLKFPWHIILDVASGLVVIGFLLMLAYEILAKVNQHIPFTKDLPLITWIVRPWLQQHPIAAVTIAAIILGAIAWLVLHFFFNPTVH